MGVLPCWEIQKLAPRGVDVREMEDLKQKVEEAQKRLQAWPDKGEELGTLLPREGLCSLCYLAGKTEQPEHDLVILCPHPSALLVPYRWSNGRLRARERYMADKSTFVDLVKAITERYAGVNPATTGRWMRLHGAAQELLVACEAVEKAHIKRTSTFLLPYCVLCGRVQPQGPAEYDDRHEDGCPMPQVQAAIAKASPQAR